MKSEKPFSRSIVLLALLSSLVAGTLTGGGTSLLTRWLAGGSTPAAPSPARAVPLRTATVAASPASPLALVRQEADASPTAAASPTTAPRPTATPVPSPTATVPAPVTLAGNVDGLTSVNLRAAPDTTAGVLAILEPATPVTVLGRTEDTLWLQVQVGEAAQVGWITASLVILTGDAASLPVPPALPAP